MQDKRLNRVLVALSVIGVTIVGLIFHFSAKLSADDYRVLEYRLQALRRTAEQYRRQNQRHTTQDIQSTRASTPKPTTPAVQYSPETRLNETGLPFDVVPNIVHYILFTVHEIEFAHFVSILSVLKNQRPERIYIHCDCHQLTGDYWQRILWLANKTNTKVTVRYVEKPTEIFGHKLSQKWLLWHSSDVMRIRLLQEFGGIYLDRDVYVVKPLNTFFKYEMTLEWDRVGYLGSQVLIAHRNARFLQLWIETYHNYLPNHWYLVGVYATDHILRPRPELIHRTRHQFADDGQEVCPKLFNTYSNEWQQFHAIPLFIRGDRVTQPNWCFARLAKQPAVQQFNETNIYQLRTTFAEMARIVFDFEKGFK